MGIKIYGIKNCNSMKKTFELLQNEGTDYEFIDYKKEKPSKNLLKGFLKQVNLSELVNKNGTTYKKLSPEQKILLENQDTALPLIAANSSMIKRPIVQFADSKVIIGFQEVEILEKAKSEGEN